MDQQQQKLLLQQQHQQQQQQQQQFLLLQQLQKQAHQQQQASAISRFPSNIDAHLRPPGLNRSTLFQNPNPNPNPNSSSNSGNSQQQHSQGRGSSLNQNSQQQQTQQQPKGGGGGGGGGGMVMRPPPVNQAELQMAYQDAWRVCHPDFKRPFSSLEDACERLLPYHVVADYEAEEDDRILDSDTTGQMPSRCQQWDHNIAAKVAEFTGTFEKQALAFNIITRKRALGEFRSEERLMIEQALLHEEKRMLVNLKTEMDARAVREAQSRMAAMVQAEQVRAESHAHAEMMAQGPIRVSALGSQGNNMAMVHDMAEQEHNVNPEEMMNGWGNNAQRDEKEPSEDFLNDDENENGDTGAQGEWREVEEFDLNTR